MKQREVAIRLKPKPLDKRRWCDELVLIVVQPVGHAFAENQHKNGRAKCSDGCAANEGVW